MVFVAIGVLIVSIVVYALTGEGDLIAGMPRDEFPRFAAPVSIVILLLSGLAHTNRSKLTQLLKVMMSWVLIFMGVLILYAYRAELSGVRDRVMAELQPGLVQTVTPGGVNGHGAVVRIQKDIDGHFIARAAVNGQHISMIVDTGASTVVLRPEDAKRVGIQLSELKFTIPVDTANGRAMAARVRLEKVALGNLTIENVDALITRQGALQQSLLGMSFLSRLQSYEFSGNQLMLRS